MNTATLENHDYSLGHRCAGGVALALLLLALPASFGAAITSVVFSTSTSVLYDFFGTRLSGGNPAVDHDGTVVQLGYHSAATVGNEFAGTWIPLTGEGSANTAYSASTIGDSWLNGTGDGIFDDGWRFILGSATMGQNLPAAGTPLAFRFFDGKTIAESFFFEEAASPNWLWEAPTTDPFAPPLRFYLSDPKAKLYSGFPIPTSRGIMTQLPAVLAPEPTLAALLAAGLLALATKRRHRG